MTVKIHLCEKCLEGVGVINRFREIERIEELLDVIYFLLDIMARILIVYWRIYCAIVTGTARLVTLTVVGVHIGLVIRHVVEGGVLP